MWVIKHSKYHLPQNIRAIQKIIANIHKRRAGRLESEIVPTLQAIGYEPTERRAIFAQLAQYNPAVQMPHHG